MKGTHIIMLLSLLMSKRATATELLAGARSISMSLYYGSNIDHELFTDKLGDLPVGNEVIIIGVETIKISFHSQVESIQLTYRLSNGSLYSTPRRGGTKYKQFSIELAPDEFVEKIEGQTDGTCINQISFYIRNVKNYEERICGPFGEAAGKTFIIEGHAFGFYGNYNSSFLLGIGLIVLSSVKEGAFVGTRPMPGDRNYGYNFDDHPDYLFPVPAAKITKISIGFNYYNCVSAIQTEYLLFDGRMVAGPWNKGKYDYIMANETIKLEESEWLIGIVGVTNRDHVLQISFITLTKSGSIETYGPYGNPAHEQGADLTPFTTYGKHILSFNGNIGFVMYGISAYYDEE